MKNKSDSGTIDTRTRILDVAEQHFADYGYTGTSLRGIVKAAGVNVAAVAYHFGDKEVLFVEVMKRFAIPVVEQQLKTLQDAMTSKDPSIDKIVRAFYGPPIMLVAGLGERGKTLSLFLGRSQTETGAVFELVDSNFAGCRNAFIKAFREVSPKLSEADQQWNFEFMLSLIVCFLTRQEPIRKRYEAEQNWNSDEVIDRLTKFCCNGMSKM